MNRGARKPAGGPRTVLLGVLALAVAGVAGVGLIEGAWRLLGLRSTVLAEYDSRYRLIGTEPAGDVFRNVGDIFVYEPGRQVRTVAWYDTPGGFVREYDYRFRANNLGLAQAKDVEPGVPSILFLGDSFTEGQGAAPWLDAVADRLAATGLQTVNGGLFGTGFAQWLRLHDHLVGQGLRVERVVVVFIGEDIRRGVWNFPPEALRCLRDYRSCTGAEGLLGLPPDDDQRAFIEDLRARRRAALPAGGTGPTLRRLFPATTEAWYFLRYVLDTSARRDNVAAIRKLVATYGDRVLFVHIPNNWNLAHGMSLDSTDALDVIAAAGGRVFDGFSHCGLTSADLHPHDGHYNAAGYGKLAACVLRATEEFPAVRPAG